MSAFCRQILLFSWLLSTVLPASAEEIEEVEEPSYRVREVSCAELKTITCKVLISHLGLYRKTEFTPAELQALNTNALHLTNFKSVEVSYQIIPGTSDIKVLVKAEENIAFKTEIYGGAISAGTNFFARSAFRLTHHGLTGKNHIWDFDAQRYWALKDPTFQSTQFDVRFIQLALTRELFLVSNLSYFDRTRNFNAFDRFQRRFLATEVMLGYRFLGYYYAGVGFGLVPIGDLDIQFKDEYAKINQRREVINSSVFTEVGAAFENDPYFPTSGVRANIRASYLTNTTRGFKNMGVKTDASFGLRYTLPLPDQSYAVLKMYGTPKNHYRPTMEQDNGITLGVGHDFEGHTEIKKTRLFFEGGYGSFEINPITNIMKGWIARTGVRMQTESFGLVELFAMSSTE